MDITPLAAIVIAIIHYHLILLLYFAIIITPLHNID